MVRMQASRFLKVFFSSARRPLLYGSRCASTFRATDLTVELSREPGTPPPENELVFGKSFSPHMMITNWNVDSGWSSPRITPVRNLSIHPGSKCLHYAIQLFEGMKAFRGVDDKIRLFRPEKNIARMLESAERSCLPSFDGDELMTCIRRLIEIDVDWVPRSTKSSLYVRPTMIGCEPSLGVNRSADCLLYVLTGPVGPYFRSGLKPVGLLADPKFVRAAPGGTGNYKVGSNYGPTIFVQQEAEKRGMQQVLWLYGKDHQVTEVGTMNLFVFWQNESGEMELVTPPLQSGLILPGVTRLSLLELARQWGEFKVTERTVFMKDILNALNDNRLREMFGAGTACIVNPVKEILYDGQTVHIPTMDDGAPVTMRFLKELTDIQYGRAPTHPWASVVC